MGTIRWEDMYPGMAGAGVSAAQKSTAAAASGPQIPMPATAPVIVLAAIIVLLVVVRVVYEMAPASGKGI